MANGLRLEINASRHSPTLQSDVAEQTVPHAPQLLGFVERSPTQVAPHAVVPFGQAQTPPGHAHQPAASTTLSRQKSNAIDGAGRGSGTVSPIVTIGSLA